MKKTLKMGIFCIVVVVLLTSLVFVAGATEAEFVDESRISLEQRIIGTWRWENQHSWIVVFREDGTMLDGAPLWRSFYNWSVIDDRLIVDGVDWNIRIDGDAITVDRYGSSFFTYTYVWYGDSTEGEASFLIFYIIAAIIIFIIAASIVVGIILLVYFGRKNRNKNEYLN